MMRDKRKGIDDERTGIEASKRRKLTEEPIQQCLNEHGENALHIAARKGDLEQVKALVGVEAAHEDQAGPYKLIEGIDKNNNTPLFCALICGHLAVATFLIENGAKLDHHGIWRDTPLHLVASKGYREIATTLIERNSIGINAKNSWGDTPLHEAIREGHLEIAALLIKNGAEVSHSGSGGYTPLHWAAEKGYREIATLLIESSNFDHSNINTKDAQGNTPLYWAITENHVDMVNFLINNGADVNHRNNNGDTPLHWAVEKGYKEIATILIRSSKFDHNNINAENKWGRTPLYAVDPGRYLDMVNFLINNGAEEKVFGYNDISNFLVPPQEIDYRKLATTVVQCRYSYMDPRNINVQNEWGDPPLLLAIREGYLELVQFLIENGADVNHRNNHRDTPLHWAVKSGDIRIAAALIQSSNFDYSNINAKGRYDDTPLLLAIREGYLELVQFLIENGADVNQEGLGRDIPLHRAVQSGDIRIAAALIQSSNFDYSNINAKGSYDDTPLFCAIKKNQVDMVKFLIENGADVNQEGLGENIPLHWAVKSGDIRIAAALIQSGNFDPSTINAENDLLHTPLYYAIKENRVDMVKFLIEKGADVSHPNKDGDTPLHLAALIGHIGIATTLIQSAHFKPGDIKVQNNEGNTPLHVAMRGEHWELAILLIKKGSKLHYRNKHGDTPLHLAARSGYMEIATILIQSRCFKPRYINAQNAMSHTPLKLAIAGKHWELAAFLIKNDQVSYSDQSGDTPLHWLAGGGYIEIATNLIQFSDFNPRDINAQNRWGTTPLHTAVHRGYKELVILLIKSGAKVDCRDRNGNTPLHLAARRGYREIAAILINSRDFDCQNINAKNSNGDTPLHMALHSPNIASLEMAKFLIENGADVLSKDRGGTTPLSLFQQHAAQLPEWEGMWKKTLLKAYHFKLTEIWEMQTTEYDSYLQWMPREISEDVMALVTVGVFSVSQQSGFNHSENSAINSQEVSPRG